MSLAAAFEDVLEPSVGAEEELMLLAPDSLLLAPSIEEALAELNGDLRVHAELRQAQIELITRPCLTAADVGRELAASRRACVEALAGRLRLAGAGTHPIATDWGPLTDSPRYLLLAREHIWAARQPIACGLHVHVAIRGAARALAVHNAARAFLPEILALGANAPFLGGLDTGLATVRPKLNQAWHRSGVPPAFPSWDAYHAFVTWGARGGLFPDASHFWWDLRLHPRLGTLEFRVADAQTSADDTTAIAAVCQSLATWLGSRHDDGEQLPEHEWPRIEENVWRATRYGVQGFMVDLETGRQEPTRERIDRLLEALRPVASELACEEELAGARTLLAGNGADRQRLVAAGSGVEQLPAWLAEQTERV